MSQSLLDHFPLISRIRRNHGLEHATMSVLGERFKGLPMAGMSGAQGFVLFADLPTEIVCDAGLEALKRLEGGESKLAVHPNCGTNLTVASLLAGLTAWIVMAGMSRSARLKIWKFPLALLFAVPVFILTKPLGMRVQRTLTTNAEPNGMQLAQVTSQRINDHTVHRVKTRF